MWACQKGHTATAELLITKGADVKAKDKVKRVIMQITHRAKPYSWLATVVFGWCSLSIVG
jgi:ankyrin repeat protein